MRWSAGVLVCVLLLGFGFSELINARSFQLGGELVDRVDSTEKVVALTLDDGPSERAPEVLRTLADLGVPATFYLNGSALDTHPDLGRAIVAAGHEVGNHTYSHRRMVFVTPGTVRDEVERTDTAIRAAGYTGEITFRPPHGKKFLALPRYLAEHGRTTVMWDVEPRSAVAAEIADEAVRAVRPGSIVLLHVMYGSGAALAAIPRIVGELRGRGYRFVRVSELRG
ncbi:polysaccharide deacetylase family protein [Nocardia harenae]|uniref:polysaccharide deacetylase family protein n=1 Tax=Nocardia harenae TaxID=358707 RepID=UPI000ACB9978|nr:polysaccharide deacetylase family protein [Nocardia harenae]